MTDLEGLKLCPPLDYPFTEAEMNQAFDEWGCNCGPASLAFALQLPLDSVRRVIPDFAQKGYVSPTMMKRALIHLGAKIRDDSTHPGFTMCANTPSLVRIQWTGPWTEPGANPKWAYRQTHWIATWKGTDGGMVFDCNGGARTLNSWEREIVPFLVANIKRASGGWYPTHVWRLT